MAARSAAARAPIAPEWPPERSLREIRKQLDELHQLQDLFDKGGPSKVKAWQQVTESILHKAFQRDHHIFNKFFRATTAGSWIDAMYNDYSERLSALEIVMNTAIADLKMSLPEEDIQGVYEGGDQYQFCRDLRALAQLANQEVLIVDPYLDPELFDVYVDSLAPAVTIRVLTAQLKPNVLILSQKFSAGRADFELRTATNLHDRVLFVDDRCWVIGQSIKDAARTKPTYIVEHTNELMRKMYQPIWDGAASVVKS